MRGARTPRILSLLAAGLLAAWGGLAGLAASPAGAVSMMDGRLEVHGFYEAQIRSIVRDYDLDEGWDLTQWWNILNLEIEADIAPDGVGPFDLITMFARVEVRFDCVWTAACGIFPSADAYRIGHKDRRLPWRLVDGQRTGFQGTNYSGDRRYFFGVPYQNVGHSPIPEINQRPNDSRKPMGFPQTNAGDGFFASTAYGPDGEPAIVDGEFSNVIDDPPLFFFDQMLRSKCDEWGVRHREGGTADGRREGDNLILNPGCDFDTLGAAAFYPNPFRRGDFNAITGTGGGLALPFRPATNAGNNSNADITTARGLYYPNAVLQQALEAGELDRYPFHPMDRPDLQWNHGQSQRDQRELKELYFDIEMFDSQLWLRLGYQTIVWGKTELFRNQDQFNPQDLALASLPSLEESRISLWAARAVWSFYDVGPFNDVRVEVAANIDQYESVDLGLCGEPYTVLAACALSVGQIAHGYFGFGLAGSDLPPAGWESWSGIEVGGRVEWRWGRFSFAVTDFYGHQDFPYVDTLYSYSRNVDPLTGRPRTLDSAGRCRDGDDKDCLTANRALDQHHANQTLFALTCADTINVSSLDPGACLSNIFGSQNLTDDPGVTSPRVVVALATIASGDSNSAFGLILPGLANYTAKTQSEISRYSIGDKVTVNLNIDPNDGGVDLTTTTDAGNALLGASDFASTVAFFYAPGISGSLSEKLTDQQEALLGCGAFYDTSCDLDGLDLLNAEASALYQSFPDVAGTFNGNPADQRRWNTTDRGVAQPGTHGFFGGPSCTRYENGKTYVLPGCRGPGDSGYDPNVDGTTAGLLHPFTAQQFNSEMAAVSWNFLMGLVGLSLPGEGEAPTLTQFDAADPFRKDGCSFRQPQWCSNVTGLLSTTGMRRAGITAGGNPYFGRRDHAWHTGGIGVARVDKTNTLGFGADFAEDITKSNWGFEFTWVNDIHLGDNDSLSGSSLVDLYRMTISVDRPTFVNFLNANRTFFINTQWFFQYIEGFEQSFTTDGSWNIFGVLAISTGYFQDRLLVSMVGVYFVMNNSMAFLPQVTYRFNDAFSASVGVAAFAGHESSRVAALSSLAPEGERFGRNANDAFVENGLSVVRERDEIFLRVRYTF
jgi:hypothetical protein